MDLTPVPAAETVSTAPPAAWRFTFLSCATAALDPVVYQQVPLDPANLTLLEDEDGVPVNASSLVQRPGLLFEVPVPSTFLDPRPWNATFRVAAATDGVQPPGSGTFTLALFSPPGFHPWRPLQLVPAPDNASVLEATVTHPAPVAGTGGQSLMGLLVPNNGSATTLLVDALQVTMSRIIMPDSPELVFAGATGSFWQFHYPGGGASATLGRAHGFVGGAPEVIVASNGVVVDGATPPFSIPGESVVTSALVELAPEAVGSVAVSWSGPTLAPAGGASAPGHVFVGLLPVVARPIVANVVLSGLVAAGTLDAWQGAAFTSQVVGNTSGAERAAAQTFTVESNGTLAAVAVNFANASGRPVAPLAVAVANVTAGQPGNLTLATGLVNASAAALGGWVEVPLLAPLDVVAGQALAIVITSPGAVDGEYWEWRRHDGIPSDPYTNGSSFVAANASGLGGWAPNATLDFTFRALLDKPLDPMMASAISVAGAIGPGIPSSPPGNRTEYVFEVPGPAVTISPTGGANGQWNVTVSNALADDVRFNWSAAVEYALYPRAVELGVADEAPILVVAELDRPMVVDFTDALAAALGSGNYTAAASPWGPFHDLPLRVHADGPASVRVRDLDVTYNVTLHVTGFSSSLNQVLAAVAPAEPLAEGMVQLLALEGEVRLTNLSIEYSEAPRYFDQPPALLPEGAVNATVADLLQLFTDDYDTFNLTYTVLSVFPGAATAAIYRSALDANLTLTMTDPEYAGPVLIAVLATDSTGLSTVSNPIHVDIYPVDDPPVIQPVLPNLVLLGTTGVLDLAELVLDNDTALADLTVQVSSPFVTVSGLVLTFDYRSAPPSFVQEDVTITISDGNSTVGSLLRVLIQNAGRPLLEFPPSGQVWVTEGRSTTIDLGAFATDDDDVANLTWEVLLVQGDGTAELAGPSALLLTGQREGRITVSVSARDKDLNLANGTLEVLVRPNLPPVFTALDGSRVTVAAGDPLVIDLREFLADLDDPFTNLTFAVAWDNGTVVDATVTDGVLTLRRPGEVGGHARVTITASDPSGATDSASLEVDVEDPVAGDPGFLFLLVAAVAALMLGVVLVRSLRRGKGDRRSLAALSREEGGMDLDEGEPRLVSPEGLEQTEEERMLGKIAEMELEAGATRLELPPVSIVSPEGPIAASSLLLLYRDGRPIAWVASASPSEREAEVEQELAAAVAERLKKGPKGGRIEDESIEMAGSTFAIEARAQLVLAARVEGGPKNQPLRLAMRIGLDQLFDRNVGALKRWDGSTRELKGIDDSLETVMRVAPVPARDPAPARKDDDEE
jgi:hypothetical protein